jgi:L-lactate permease
VVLAGLRKASWIASLAGLATAAVVAVAVYGMPVSLAGSAVAYGAAQGLFPIGWVVFAAILLYNITVATGQFDVVRASVGNLTFDRRLQALLIAFAFGAFIEGAAGFGTPVAVAAAMLTGLGFKPFRAATICLLANTAPVAFGSIGTPLIMLSTVTGLPLLQLSRDVGRICAPVSLFIPAYLVLVMGGWKALRGVLPAAALCGLSFAGVQFLV